MFIKKILFSLLFIHLAHFCFSQKKKNSLYVFVAEECPISIFMMPTLKAVSEEYGSKINFYLVFPFATSTEKTAALFKTKYKLNNYTIKVDKLHTLTKKYNALVTPEVIITGIDDAILYKGRINDAYLQPGKRKHMYTGNDLSNALAYIANGREMPKPWKHAVGCYITRIK